MKTRNLNTGTVLPVWSTLVHICTNQNSRWREAYQRDGMSPWTLACIGLALPASWANWSAIRLVERRTGPRARGIGMHEGRAGGGGDKAKLIYVLGHRYLHNVRVRRTKESSFWGMNTLMNSFWTLDGAM